jgi:hypothetical protein
VVLGEISPVGDKVWVLHRTHTSKVAKISHEKTLSAALSKPLRKENKNAAENPLNMERGNPVVFE